jgi:hypothetical protein
MESGGSSRPRSGAGQSQASGPPRNPRWQVGWFSPAPPSAFDRHRSGALEDITKSLASGWRTTRRRQLREPFPTVRARLAAHPSLLLRSVRTRAGPLAATAGAEAPTGTGTLPLLGFVTLMPLHRHTLRASTPSAPSCPGSPSGRRHHPSSSRSVLVVSHHLDGFLRAKDHGLVASRYRSWGSPRFPKPAPHGPRTRPPKWPHPKPG